MCFLDHTNQHQAKTRIRAIMKKHPIIYMGLGITVLFVLLNLSHMDFMDSIQLKFYDIMFRLLNETEKTGEILNIRLDFSKNLLEYSNSLKKVHPNLPAALHDYMENLDKFTDEIDKIIEELKKKSSSGIISPFDFRERNDTAEIVKKQLATLCLNEDFLNHIKSMLDISKTNILE